MAGPVTEGASRAVIFKLDSTKQEAALETARRKVAEVDAALAAARVEDTKAEGQLQEAKAANQQAVDELETKRELQRRNAGVVPQRDIEKLELAVAGRLGSLAAAAAAKQATETRISTLLPAEKPAPRPRSPRPRSISTRPMSAPASPDGSSSSRSGSATSSIP